MIARLMRNPRTTTLGIGVSLASLLFLAPGCGSQGPSASDAIVEVNEPSQGSAPGGAAPAPAAVASNTPAAPAKDAAPADNAPAVKSEGWGTLKGRVVFVGDPPAPKVEIPEGKAPKDPTV